ncbi:MAG: hypothetical protein JWN94_3994 [Betaproteobacteria bacterium]|nr:hypothetical protein [Betaproteobacteria bacterium]
MAGVCAIVFAVGGVAAAESVPADWMTVTAGDALTLRAPRGTTFVRTQSADSLTGTFKGPGFLFDIDYGLYSDPLKTTGAYTDFKTADIRIDGKAARMTLATFQKPQSGRRYFFGLHAPDVATTALGKLKLTVTAAAKDRAELELIERMIGTIRFK